MTKQKLADPEADGIFEWKFRIIDRSPVFKYINNGSFKKIGNPNDNVYVCDSEHPDYESSRALAEMYINERPEICQIYIPEKDSTQTPSSRYVIEEGRFIVYKSKSQIRDGEMVWVEYGLPITENFYMVIDEDIEFDDGSEKIHKYIGRIIVDESKEFKFDVDSRSFATPQEMAKVLSNIGGSDVIFDNNNLKDVRIAMQWTSKDKVEKRKVSQIFGWKGTKIYRSQSSVILADGVKKVSSEVDLSDIPRACNLDILPITNKDFNNVGNHIVKDLMRVHARYPIDCLFGFTFLAPIASQIVTAKKWSGGRIGMWLVGSSQCGKSHTAILFQNFFGDFAGEGTTFAWGGTPLSVQDGGYYFKDAVFMVDDFKIAEFGRHEMPNLIKVLQNYAEGTSRTRYSMNLGRAEGGKPIRGSLLITGEDILDDVASIMTRYHVVRMNDAGMNESAFNKTKDYVEFYSGFMGRYIAWILKDPKSVEHIVDRIEKVKSEFMAQYDGVNVNRIAQSFAYNLVGFDMFCRFLEKNRFISMEKHIEMVKTHKNNLFSEINPHVESAKDATIGSVFIRTLQDLINSGAVKIHDVANERSIAYGRDEYVGFDDLDEFIYFFGEPVWNAVKKAASSDGHLMNSKTNLLNELVHDGILIQHVTKDGEVLNTYSKKLYGKSVRTWRILKSKLGWDEEVVTEEDMEGW